MEILGRRQRERKAFNQRERGWHSTKNDVVLLIYIIKKIVGSQLGLPGSSGFRVDPPGRSGFARPNPRLVFSLTRPGSRTGSTRRAGPGFKTMPSSLISRSISPDITICYDPWNTSWVLPQAYYNILIFNLSALDLSGFFFFFFCPLYYNRSSLL